MINEKDIKPIPKYMKNLIYRLDKLNYPEQKGNVRFYNYFAIWKKHLVQVTVAVKNKYKKWYCKQVIIHTVNGKICYLKDIKYNYMTGYSVGWFDEGLTEYQNWYEGDWDYTEDKYFNVTSAPTINPELALKIYKYSAISLYTYQDKLKYLNMYEKFPQVEYLLKLGLINYVLSKQIVKKASKDKKFRKWLIQHVNELKTGFYYISTILNAYKNNKDIYETQKVERFKKEVIHNERYKEIVALFGNIENLFNYLDKQKIGISNYIDYYHACRYLEIDMSLDKNKIPHEFMRWHDIRIDEMHSKQAELDRKQKQELYDNFEKVSNKYLLLQRQLKDNFITIIAKSPLDLINEGEKLHHCVGRMGYDQKFAREETLIFFVRDKDNPQTPFVTFEYSIKNKKILQCYGDHDSTPKPQVINFVYNIWLPYAKRKLRKLAI